METEEIHREWDWVRCKTLKQRMQAVLIEGPGGSGKTELVCNIIKRELERTEPSEQEGMFLLTAFTHTAVDNLRRRLSKTLNEDPHNGRLHCATRGPAGRGAARRLHPGPVAQLCRCSFGSPLIS